MQRLISRRRLGTIWTTLQLSIVALSMFHIFLHFHTTWNAEWTLPFIPRNILLIIPSDITVISIMTLVSILSVRTFLAQLRTKPNDQEFRSLFHESIFGEQAELRKWKLLPILIVISVPLSIWYICTMVFYIYYNWKIELLPFLHPLLLYPAVLLIFQTTLQGCFLLWTFSLPSFAEHLKGQNTFLYEMQEYINTNLVLLLNCICVTVIVTSEEKMSYNFAIGEIFFRVLSVITLATLTLKTSATPVHSMPSPPTNSDESVKTPIVHNNNFYFRDSSSCTLAESDSTSRSASSSIFPPAQQACDD